MQVIKIKCLVLIADQPSKNEKSPEQSVRKPVPCEPDAWLVGYLEKCRQRVISAAGQPASGMVRALGSPVDGLHDSN